jgi:hypothetical protein
MQIVRHLLRQEANTDILLVYDFPSICGQITMDEFHEGRFSRSIAAQQANPLTVFELEIGVV